MWQELDNNIFSWEPGKRRSGSLNAHIWQLVQSSITKAENVENDFNEIAAAIREMGWGDGKKNTRFGREKEEEENRVRKGAGFLPELLLIVVDKVFFCGTGK